MRESYALLWKVIWLENSYHGTIPRSSKISLSTINIIVNHNFTILSIVYLQQPVFYIPGELISLLQCKNENQVPKRANQSTSKI